MRLVRVRRVVLAVALLPPAMANVYRYTDNMLPVDVVQYRRVGMWAPHDAPHGGGGDAGSSTVGMDIRFQRSPASSMHAGVVQVLVFHAAQLPRVGVQLPGVKTRSFCCTSALARSVQGCTAPGKLIVAEPPPGGVGAIHMHDVVFGANQTTASLSQRLLVKESGIHYLALSSCEVRTGTGTIYNSDLWPLASGLWPLASRLWPLTSDL